MMNVEQPRPQPRRMELPPPPVELPPLPVEPPPLPQERELVAPEALKSKVEAREVWSEHALFSAAMIGKAAIKPKEYAGPCEDAYGIFPEYDMAMVNDGVSEGGWGGVAARAAREAWIPHLRAARKETALRSERDRAAAWDEIMTEGQAVITPRVLALAEQVDRATEKESGARTGSITREEEKFARARAEEIKEARERFAKTTPPPEAVRDEAIAIFEGLRTLSDTVAETRAATTSSGVRVMQVDEELYGIFWGVGDSSAFVETTDHTTGEHTLELAVPTDDALGVYARLGVISPEQIADFENSFIWEANRALGDTVVDDLRWALTDDPDTIAEALQALKEKLNLSGKTPGELQAELRTRLALPDDLTDPTALTQTLATKLGAPHNGVLRDLRFKMNTQALGQRDIMPHIAVIKLEPGTRFRLASDGYTDGAGLFEDPKATVLKRNVGFTLRNGTRASMAAAIKAFRASLGKAGADDIAIVDGEVQATETFNDTETKWALLVEESLTNEEISGRERARMQAELLAPPVRDAIMRVAVSEAAARGVTDDAAVTALLRNHLALRIVDLRLEPLQKQLEPKATAGAKTAPEPRAGDMAAE